MQTVKQRASHQAKQQSGREESLNTENNLMKTKSLNIIGKLKMYTNNYFIIGFDYIT